MEKKEKELDLLDLLSIVFKAIGSFLKNTVKYFVLTVIFSFKKALYFIPFLLIGAGIAFYMTMPQKRKYRAEVILRLNDGDAFMVRSITDAFASSYIKVPKSAENRKVLADLMEITPDIAATVKNIEAFYLVDLFKNGSVDYIDFKRSFKEDTSHVVVRNQIAIRFESSTQDNFYDLQNGFMHFLNNSSFLAQQRDIRQAYDKAQVIFYTAEIAALDSLRNLEHFQRGDRPAMVSRDGVMMVSTDKQLFQQQLIDLNNAKRYHERRLEEGADVALITSPLSIDNKPVVGTLKTLAVALVVSYLIGLVCLLLIFNRRTIAEWIEK